MLLLSLPHCRRCIIAFPAGEIGNGVSAKQRPSIPGFPWPPLTNGDSDEMGEGKQASHSPVAFIPTNSLEDHNQGSKSNSEEVRRIYDIVLPCPRLASPLPPFAPNSLLPLTLAFPA